VMLRSHDRTQEAVDTFGELSALDPTLASRSEAQIIETWRAAKEFEKAAQVADAAAAKYPEDKTIASIRASVLADMGRGEEGAQTIRKLMEGEGDRETWLQLAQIYEKAKNYEQMGKALDAAEKLSEGDDEMEMIHFMRGAMYERSKDFDNAEKSFRKVLEMNPENSSALNYLGYMFADRNVRLQEAHDLVKKALDLEPNNGAYLDSLGWIYYRMDRLPEAEAHLRRALERYSRDPVVNDHLGDVYFKQGKLKEAIAQWQAALKEWEAASKAELDPKAIAETQRKLESAKVRLAKEGGNNSGSSRP
jgi:tetratricopeptide (TPR) repeat protein